MHTNIEITLMMSFFGWAGLIALIAIGITGVIFLFVLFLALAAGKRQRIVMPRTMLLLLEIFFGPLKQTLPLFGGGEYAAERLGVRLYNMISKKRFAEVPLSKRMVFVPQCLRNENCPARVSSQEGFECKDCGLCIITEIRKIAPDVRVCISPGGSFALRLLKQHRPKAVLGVACPPDLFEGLQSAFHSGIPAQGVSLTRFGCVNTDVPLEAVRKKLLLGSVEAQS